jgi:DNA-directed RNA polymerase specialized sigma subunit
VNHDVTRWVDAQNEKDKLILSLVLVDKLTPEEVGKVLDVEPALVEQVVRHARVATRSILEMT